MDGLLNGRRERLSVNHSTFHERSYCLLIKWSAGFTDIPGVSNNVTQKCWSVYSNVKCSSSSWNVSKLFSHCYFKLFFWGEKKSLWCLGLNCIPTRFKRGTQWHSWLRHCATNRQVAGSIPDGVIGIFQWHNPSGRTMALGSTQPLTEMSTRNIFWG